MYALIWTPSFALAAAKFIEHHGEPGIGLATAQRILARHGGSIRGDGQPGAGASFCFTLWNDPALLAEARAAVDPA